MGWRVWDSYDDRVKGLKMVLIERHEAADPLIPSILIIQFYFGCFRDFSCNSMSRSPLYARCQVE